MSVNSSSSSLNPVIHCTDSSVGLFISTAYITTNAVLLLPLSILILCLGHRRWRRRSFATTSHSDIFTYHMAALELISVFSSAVFFCGTYAGLPEVMKVGYSVVSVVFPGQVMFHILTCVDRYLAVVHPITYLGLKNVRGVRIRNISIGCVWLLCFAWTGVRALYMPEAPVIPYFCLLGFSLVVVSFCSLSVLCVLIRPGPGEVGGDRERVDQSKRRAFHTIVAIMAVLWFWFTGVLVCLSLEISHILSHNGGCVVLTSSSWFTLPSSLVLPLLFLHRAGKLPCCN
ncbi:hypothetical protein L3Q82_003768 [Scortum barcoo]|uniref:Uncharacterized protein n=1 Tax=Scortum barcoo TaxID=214431 RepID=A0ACB8X7B0_9TELE|nr:hypothetical protein L3Q82_003768 [Scortum barcoo]